MAPTFTEPARQTAVGRLSAAAAACRSRGREHRGDQHRDRDEQRVRIRRARLNGVDQCRQQRADGDEAEVESRALERSTRRRSRRAPARAPLGVSRRAALTARRHRRSPRAARAAGRPRHSAPAAPALRGAGGAGGRPSPSTGRSTARSRAWSPRARARRARRTARRPAVRRSTRGTRRRCSSFRRCTHSPSPAGAAGRTRDRGPPRRWPRDRDFPARPVAVDDDLVDRSGCVPAEQRRLGHGTRIAPQLSQ